MTKSQAPDSTSDAEREDGDEESDIDGGRPDAPAEDGAESESGSGASAEGGPQSQSQREQDRGALREMLEDLLDSDEVHRDVAKTEKAVRSANGQESIKSTVFAEGAPLPEFACMSHQLARTLDRLREEAEPGWHRNEDSGRLNLVRWAIEQEPETAFDRWDEGVADAADIEAVVLLDNSGSMGIIREQADNAMWVLKRALDAVDVSTTVIVFDTRSEILYRRDDLAEANAVRHSLAMGGGTNPTEGLAEAAQIFSRSQRQHKLLITLTDGQWFSNYDYSSEASPEELIERMNLNGVTTALGFMYSGGEQHEGDCLGDSALTTAIHECL